MSFGTIIVINGVKMSKILILQSEGCFYYVDKKVRVPVVCATILVYQKEMVKEAQGSYERGWLTCGFFFGSGTVGTWVTETEGMGKLFWVAFLEGTVSFIDGVRRFARGKIWAGAVRDDSA